jgi:LysM repeat protein
MMIQKLFLFGSLLALTACATAQENPNYQYSSTYEEDGQVSRMASNSQNSKVVYVSPDMRASELNKQAGQAPNETNITYTNSAVNPDDYPEEVTVVRPSSVGTPGYGAYVPETVEDYDYSDNVVSANNTVHRDHGPVLEETRAVQSVYTNQPSANYVVSSGDTVYNISRRLCVNVEEVQAPNGLGNDFAIDIGQALYLPPSRC